MSTPWTRFGDKPIGNFIPLPTNAIFYLNYLDAAGHERISHLYDPAAKTFTAIGSTPITISVGASVFTLSIGGAVVLTIEDDTVIAGEFSEFDFNLGPAAIFYKRSSSLPDRLAMVRQDGLFYAPQITETVLLPGTAFQYRFVNDGNIVATIGDTGLSALNLVEGGLGLYNSDSELIAFSDGTAWAV